MYQDLRTRMSEMKEERLNSGAFAVLVFLVLVIAITFAR